MAIQDTFEQLRDFDLAELDLNNLGSWPLAVRVIILSLVVIVIAAVGYTMFVTDRLQAIERASNQEESLKREYQDKALQVSNLALLKQQQSEMRSRFDDMKRQLPTDTEVPGLLEDVTRTALDAGLKIESIDLEAERAQEIYIELPITIRVEGDYHEMARFVSGVSNLPRIVTLHDFDIAPLQGARGVLGMKILAKTYRYKEEGSGGGE